MSGLPLLFDATGPVATPPATLQANLIAQVEAVAPGYTANLPGIMIEDLTSTAVGILATIDQARVDAVNNVTPYGANAYLLQQWGKMLGIPIGQPANASVDLVFEGTPGFIVAPGFIAGDGTNQYAVQDGTVIGSGGSSGTVEAIATNAGTFGIPANTVNQIVTSVPSSITLSVNNPVAGVPATQQQTVESYRAQVMQAQQIVMTGTPTMIKTLLGLVPGVSPRLIGVIQNGVYYEVICGGGDPYAVALAIYQGVSSVGLLTGSATTIRNVTVSLFDPPDSYSVVFVNPPAQVVTGTITWNTTLPNFTASAAVNQFIQNAATAYVNSIPVGSPINLMVLTQQIQAAIASVLDAVNLTTLTFAFNVNGTPVTPSAGTDIILSDPESYFSATATAITAVQ